jgi:hypothetical protein
LLKLLSFQARQLSLALPFGFLPSHFSLALELQFSLAFPLSLLLPSQFDPPLTFDFLSS